MMTTSSSAAAVATTTMVVNPVELIKQVIENIHAQLQPLDFEIGNASQGDSSYVKALFDSLHEMKSRAEQADMILAQVLADPVKLELAIARIEGPSDTYSKLTNLVAKVDELEQEITTAEYDYFTIVAELLLEVQEQMVPFEPYIATPQIGMVKSKVLTMETELKKKVQWSFREIGQLATSERYSKGDGAEVIAIETEPAMDLTFLHQIDLLIDALGKAFTNDLMERFAQLQLIPYEKMFKIGTKYAGLEYLDQRFAWFKYLLSVVDSKLSSVLKAHWCAPAHLFNEFSRRTKKHITDVLTQTEKENPEANAHVAYVLKALQSVLAFEAEIKASFSVKGNATLFEAKESMGDAFDPFLGPYVQREREELEKLMETVMRAEEESIRAVPTEGATVPAPGEPFESSRKMFEYMKKSLFRCADFSTGITFLSLSKEFRVCLQQYSESLKFRCPNPDPRGQIKPGKLPIYNINKQIEATLCRIISTGEYCIDTVPAQEKLMKSKIQSQFLNEVDFSSQIDAFMDLVSHTMNVLASGEVFRLDGDFIAMRKINWSALEDVGDVGPYAKHMFKILTDGVGRIRQALSPAYFQNMCTKLAAVFLDEFLDNIWQLRRVSKTGGGQLLMDLHGVKEYLLKMPNAKLQEGQEPVNVSLAYTSTVKNKCKRIEVVLKLVCTEENLMEETFSALWPDGTTADMDAVIAIKGGRGIILPINPAAIHKTITKGAATNAADIKTGLLKVGDNVKNVMGDILSGNIFQDDSSHGHSTHSSSSNGTGTSHTHDLKHAIGELNAVFGFKSAITAKEKDKSGGSATKPYKK